MDSINWQRNKSLKERMDIMLLRELNTDVTFRVSADQSGEPERIKAHTFMLVSASPVFWSMFCGDLQETGDIEVLDVEPQAFREMLRFIYSEQCNINGDNVMHILHASKKYDIPLLTTACVDFMDKSLNPSNACSILEHSIFFEEKELANRCMLIIEYNTQSAFSSEAFINISQNTLASVLESDDLKMEEIDIFKRCCDWAANKNKHKPAREVLGKALYQIRFPMMSLAEFTTAMLETNMLTKEEQQSINVFITTSDEQKRPSLFKYSKRKIKGNIVCGSKVRVKQSVSEPKYHWGNVDHKDIGKVAKIDGPDAFVSFPSLSYIWRCALDELELI